MKAVPTITEAQIQYFFWNEVICRFGISHTLIKDNGKYIIKDENKINKEAKQKRNMLCEILGLKNYLLHLDYIDRQIMLEQQNTKINFVINDFHSNNSSQMSSPRRGEGKDSKDENNKSIEISSTFGNENEEKKFKSKY